MTETRITQSTFEFDNSKHELKGIMELVTEDMKGEPCHLHLELNATNHFEELGSYGNANATKVYISDQLTQNPIQDMISGYRYARPYQWYKTWVPQVIAAMFAAVPYEPYPYKLSWSQYAGCDCPCSPGFLLKDADGYTMHLCFNSMLIEMREEPIEDTIE